MKGLREKFRKNEGFTLVEMLIVVAIIAILMMVSIPLVNSSLEKARHAVDQANVRDAVSLGTVEYLTATEDEKAAITAKKFGYVVATDGSHTGTLEENATGVAGMCQECKDDGTLQVSIAADGKVTAQFTSP